MGKRWIVAGMLAVACYCQATETVEAKRIFRFMENKNYNIRDYGERMPYATFDRGYYSTRYPFNRYYTQQAYGFHGFHEFNR